MKYKISKIPDVSGEYQLVASENISAGEMFLQELPLVYVKDVENEDEWLYPWRLTEEILANKEIFFKYISWGLNFKPTPYFDFMLEYEIILGEKYSISSSAVRDIYFSVVTNNINFCDMDGNIAGWGMYKFMSRANHSCDPNAASIMNLTYKNIANKYASLVAIRNISIDESITWSYPGLNSDFINSNYVTRGQFLFDRFFFACRCERCLAEMPEDVADTKTRLAQYWQEFKESISV